MKSLCFMTLSLTERTESKSTLPLNLESNPTAFPTVGSDTTSGTNLSSCVLERLRSEFDGVGAGEHVSCLWVGLSASGGSDTYTLYVPCIKNAKTIVNKNTNENATKRRTSTGIGVLFMMVNVLSCRRYQYTIPFFLKGKNGVCSVCVFSLLCAKR